MKYSLVFILCLTIATYLCAQTPQNMSYQAVVRNASGQVLANKLVGLKISIIQTEVSGVVVYSETHTPTTNDNGLIGIEIGGGTMVAGSFAEIDWTKGPYFVQSEIDTDGATNYTTTGVSQLMSVPYALHAKTAELLPRITDMQRDAILLPKEGLLVFNETTKNFNVYKNGNWYEWQATDCVPQPTIAMAGVNQNVAPQVTTTTLQGNTPSSGIGTWSVVSGNGADIAEVNNPTSSFTGRNGAHILRWTIATSCSNTTDEVTINIVDDCSNGVKDETETDIDCGGTSCEKCASFKNCIVNADCVSNNCVTGKCSPCASGLIYVASTNSCVVSCPPGLFYLSSTNTCVVSCPSGTTVVNGSCVSANK